MSGFSSYAHQRASRVDLGLRLHMQRVFALTGAGVLGSALVAWIVASLPAAFGLLYVQTPTGQLHPTLLGWLVMVSPLAAVLLFSFGRTTFSTGALAGLYALTCAALGASLSEVFALYAHASIFSVFLETSVLFLMMSLWGYTTNRDLSRWGSFLLMGLIGIILAGVVNLFLHSSMLFFLGNAAGVLVFVGLTAVNVQQAKWNGIGQFDPMRQALDSALSLYLDFINLFLSLLNLLGDRR